MNLSDPPINPRLSACDICADHHTVADRCLLDEAIADGIDEAEYELRHQLANLRTLDGQTLMEACPEIRDILDDYSRALDQAKAEAGIRICGKARASRVAARK